MSALIDRAIREAGLAELGDARHALDWPRLAALAPRLDGADLLVVGALADRIRAEEVGVAVRVYANVAPDPCADVALVSVDPHDRSAFGLALLRRAAVLRITGPHAARVRVDWGEVGLELAQVALGFGANELVGPIANRRGLPIAADSRIKVKGAGLVSVQAMKRHELAGMIRRAGREPFFVEMGTSAPVQVARAHSSPTSSSAPMQVAPTPAQSEVDRA